MKEDPKMKTGNVRQLSMVRWKSKQSMQAFKSVLFKIYLFMKYHEKNNCLP